MNIVLSIIKSEQVGSCVKKLEVLRSHYDLAIIPSRDLLVQSNNGNIRTMCKICSKLTIKTPVRFLLVSFLLNSNRFYGLFCVSNFDFQQVILLQILLIH